MTLSIHEPCKTPSGDGEITYWRYDPPNYSTIVAVSVRLFSAPERFIPYQGTVFPATDVLVYRDGDWTPVRS